MIDTASGGAAAPDDTFSDAERAYFDSRGEQSTGLFDAPPAPEVKPDAPAPEVKPEAKPAATEAKEPAIDPESGEIAVEPDGRVRDAKSGRYVPLPALINTRKELSDAKRERDELRAKWQGVVEKLQRASDAPVALSEQRQLPAPEERPIDPKYDLVGWAEQQAQRAERLERQLAEQTRAVQARIESAEAQREYERDAANFAREKPDFADAYQHFMVTRAKQLIALDPRYLKADGQPDAEKLRAQLITEENAIRDAARSRRQNPAALIYSLASDTFGYAPKQAAPAVPEKTAAQEVVERIEKGQAGATTLSKAGGTSAGGLTVDEYLAMDDSVISRRMQSDPSFRREVDRILGKR